MKKDNTKPVWIYHLVDKICNTARTIVSTKELSEEEIYKVFDVQGIGGLFNTDLIVLPSILVENV